MTPVPSLAHRLDETSAGLSITGHRPTQSMRGATDSSISAATAPKMVGGLPIGCKMSSHSSLGLSCRR